MSLTTSEFAAGRFSHAGPDGLDGRPDWHGLRARLVAAHDARRSIMCFSDECDERFGSFDGQIAASMAGFGLAGPEIAQAVNPTDLGDGKPNVGNEAHIAGSILSGDRGQ